jgi:hypothetical protein
MFPRAMREYVVVPPPMHIDPVALDGWIAKAVASAGGLPAKARKKPARKKARSGER